MFGGNNPEKLTEMLAQLGMDTEEITAETVTIESGNETLVFEDVVVNRIDARGQNMYQILGNPEKETSEDENDE